MTEHVEMRMPESLTELHADSWTAPFWEAAAEHRLVCARCAVCGTYRMPPSPFCFVCQSQETEWPELSGRGTVYTFTLIRHAVIPAMAPLVPYVVAVVALDGAPGARLISNVIGVDPELVAIDMAVHVAWDDVAEGVSIPRFVPDGADGH